LGGGAGLIPWVGGPPDTSFVFYLRETFQSQSKTEWCYTARVVRHWCHRNWRTAITQDITL